MTDDDIIMMATKAGFEPSSWPNCLDIQELREFAYLIAEKAREERAVDCQDKDSWGPTAAKVLKPVAWLRTDGFKAMTDTEKQAWITADEGIEGYWSELVKDYTIPLYK